MGVEWIRTPALEVNDVVRRWQPDKPLPRAILIWKEAENCFRLVLYSEWLYFQTLDEAVEHAEQWMQKQEFPRYD